MKFLPVVEDRMTKLSWKILLLAWSLIPSVVGSQAKPLKKIHVGVPSIGMGNIIIFITDRKSVV